MGTHNHSVGDTGTRRLSIAVGINLLLTIAQIIGGVLSGSLSLIADALHNFSDAAGLLLALVARRIAQRPADKLRTFGYGRAEVVGGLINLTSIIVIAVYLLIEAVNRAVERPEIDGWTVVIVATIALVVDVGTAVLTYSMSKDSINIKAAFLHNLADALASVAVIVSGTLIILFDWYWTDVAATISISIYIVWISWKPLKRCIRILMQSTPEGMSIARVAETIVDVEGVEYVEHIHVWSLDETVLAMEAHITISENSSITDSSAICAKIRTALDEDYGIRHVTIEANGPTAGNSDFSAEH